jgi:hypothetical protein
MEVKPLLTPSASISHEFLSSVMPFSTGWLDTGKGKPCTTSVTVANLLYLTHILASPVPPKVYTN